MSTEAYSRAIRRESGIWTPYGYQFPLDTNQIADRALIYGLYSGSFLNLHAYLIEVEASELVNLLSDYNSKIAELTTQEQVVVADIVSKRYLANIDKIIHDNKMATKEADINASDDEWTAKIAALSSDRAALETLAIKAASDIQKTAARISELEAYIATESVNLSEVDVQIAEKELQSSRVDLEQMEAENSVLKIQLDTVLAGIQLFDVDLQKARTKVDIAQTDGSIAKIGLLADNLVIEKAQTTIAEGELPVAEARIELAQAKSDEVDKEIEYYNTLTDQTEDDYANKIELMDLKQTIRIDELGQRKEEKELSLDARTDESTQNVTFANSDSSEQSTIDLKKVAVMNARVVDAQAIDSAALSVARIAAAAEITTNLTHTIGKATPA